MDPTTTKIGTAFTRKNVHMTTYKANRKIKSLVKVPKTETEVMESLQPDFYSNVIAKCGRVAYVDIQ